MTQVIRVSVENIAPIWPQVEPLLVAAMTDRPTHTAEDIRALLLAHRCQLWVQWGERVEVVLITEFASYPRGVWLRVWVASARRDTKMDDNAIFDAMEDWRLTNECRGYEACGRQGWLRRIKNAKVEGLLMRVTFDE